ncbi:hypothetical protein QUF72_11910 [Desulfobacterales bacterium HSG2]|nr:hypothetical protein [Desulfobacterales bacterium HSG2]
MIDNRMTFFKNIELGAGCGNFGKLFFSPCCLTDKNKELKIACDICHLDCFCDACELPFGENTFGIAILCNPYGYGFNTKEETEILLNELTRVLTDDSRIIIIGNHRNKYCTPKRIEKRIHQISLQGVNIHFTVKETDSACPYMGYPFLTTDGRKTNPNKEITLYVRKQFNTGLD